LKRGGKEVGERIAKIAKIATVAEIGNLFLVRGVSSGSKALLLLRFLSVSKVLFFSR